MIVEVTTILNSDIDNILKDGTLSLSLLRVYSVLYLNGGQPRACERSSRAYYSQLQKDGLMRAERQEEINKRTLKPAFKGLKYIPMPFCKHINSLYLTDNDAIELLRANALRESDFEVLPTGYRKVSTVKTRKKRIPKK